MLCLTHSFILTVPLATLEGLQIKGIPWRKGRLVGAVFFLSLSKAPYPPEGFTIVFAPSAPQHVMSSQCLGTKQHFTTSHAGIQTARHFLPIPSCYRSGDNSTTGPQQDTALSGWSRLPAQCRHLPGCLRSLGSKGNQISAS